MFEKISKYSLLILTTLSLLATAFVSREFLFPFITTKAFYFRICIELALPFYIYLILKRQDLRPKIYSLLNLFVLLFFVANLVSGILGVNWLKSIWGNFERMGGVFYLLHLVLLYFYIQLLGKMNGKLILFYLKSLVFVSALITISGISGKLGGPTLTIDPSLPTRASATLGNPIFFASFLVIPFFLCLFFVFNSQKIVSKITYAFIAFLQFIAIFQSGTRGALVGLVVGGFFGFLVYLLFVKNTNIKKTGGFALVIFLVSVFLLFKFNYKLPGTTLKRIFNLNDSNTNARLIQWKVALKGAGDYPIFGTGPENYMNVGNKYYDNELYKYDKSWFDKPHNFLLEVLVTTGIFGITMYLGMIFAYFFVIYLGYRSNVLSLSEACLFFSAMVVYQIQNIFVFDTIPASMMYFSLLGFAGYLNEINKNSLSSNEALPKTSVLTLFPETVFVVSAVFSVYSVFVFNVLPAYASKNINYGYAYSNIDPEKAENYFNSAVNSKHNFDIFETASKYADYATALVRSPLANTKKEFVEFHLKKAIEYNKEVLGKNPEDPVILQKLSNTYLYSSVFYKTAIPFEAIDALNKAIEIAPKRTEGYLALAQLRLFQGFPKEAVILVEKAINLDVNNDNIKWQFALVNYDAGEKEKAVILAEELVNKGYKIIDNGNLNWLVDYYLAKGDKEKAVMFAEKNLTVKQISPDDIAKLFLVYKFFGLEDKALSLEKEAIKTLPVLWAEAKKIIEKSKY